MNHIFKQKKRAFSNHGNKHPYPSLERPADQPGFSYEADRLFHFKATKYFTNLINREDPDDPLLKQILPVAEELESAPGYDKDPLNEIKYQPVPGLLHKYKGRVLLITTGKCAIHCRYCFRRHFPYTDPDPAKPGWEQALDYISKDPSLSEIILSGGDPLTLPDERLGELIRHIAGISHIKYLRIHSRIPVVLPTRITDTFISLLDTFPRNKVLVVHVNHPNELGDPAIAAMARLQKSGIFLFNQSVLLRGINDDYRILTELSGKLFNLGIIPYYIHMPDPVEGTSHFAVQDETAKNIMAELRCRLPGYLVPRMVKEISGKGYKIPLELLG